MNNYDERQGIEELNADEKMVYIQKARKYNLDNDVHYLKRYDGEILISKEEQFVSNLFKEC